MAAQEASEATQLEMHFDRKGADSMSSDLSRRAYELRREIQRILAETPPSEAPGRIEDVVGDALDEHGANVRRALRREYSGEE
jgi:hypothetical protein